MGAHLKTWRPDVWAQELGPALVASKSTNYGVVGFGIALSQVAALSYTETGHKQHFLIQSLDAKSAPSCKQELQVRAKPQVPTICSLVF